MAEENIGFDIKRTAKNKPYLAARINDKTIKIADFNGLMGVDLFLKLMRLFGEQVYDECIQTHNVDV